MILSTSSITVFLQCHRRWKYRYLNRIKGPQGVPPAVGSAVHAAVEAYYGKTAPRTALDRKWAEEAASIPPAELAEDPTAEADALKAYNAYLEHVAPTWKPTMVERSFSYELEGVTITGIIDSADERTDEGRDLKVTTGKSIGGRKTPTFRPEQYQLQRDLYDLGYESITGRPFSRFTLDVLTRLGRHRQYELKPSFGDTLDAVRVVRDAVSVGDYEPTGAWSGRCRFCPYNLICPDSTERAHELEDPMSDLSPTPSIIEES